MAPGRARCEIFRTGAAWERASDVMGLDANSRDQQMKKDVDEYRRRFRELKVKHGVA